MKIMVIGSGGREFAMAHKIAQSPLVTETIVAPGNVGMSAFARRVAVSVDDTAALLACAKDEAVDLVVIGPEVPLVNGLVDMLAAHNIQAFGPSKLAAQLEASKGFMKDILKKYAIPTAPYRWFDDSAAALAYIRKQGVPIVIKADGLAAGKGVTVARTFDAARQAVEDAMQNGMFGEAGKSVVIEDFLQGEELSFFVLCDGMHAIPFASAQDHKAAFTGDQGPNTGGMGAYSPAPIATKAVEKTIMDTIVTPILAAMKKEGRPYRGVLFCGVMINEKGVFVIEFNIRFGDPECQVLLQRLKSDLVPALMATTQGTLDQIKLDWHEKVVLNVVMAAKGYPGSYKKNTVIQGVAAAEAVEGVTICHAGTSENAAGELIASGGRVLNIIAEANSAKQAQARAYKALKMINWPDGYYRTDIGNRAL